MSQHLMNALANSMAFWLALILGLLVLYVLPSLIGAIRRVESLGWIIVINLLPTGIGWPAALILALVLPQRPPRYVPANSQAPGQRHWRQPGAVLNTTDVSVVPSGAIVISGADYRVVQDLTDAS